MNGIYLLSGSNLPNREEWLEKALAYLQLQDISIVQASSIYETAAWGLTEQPAFLNQVIGIRTDLNPGELLDACQQIELACNRERKITWGPRTLDLDILYYNNLVIETDRLQIPHPSLHLRRFALEPLKEIAPRFCHPILKKTNRQLLQECPDKLPVALYNTINN